VRVESGSSEPSHRIHIGPVTTKLCRSVIWHRGILIGSQGQGCPSNEPGLIMLCLSAISRAVDGKADSLIAGWVIGQFRPACPSYPWYSSSTR